MSPRATTFFTASALACLATAILLPSHLRAQTLGQQRTKPTEAKSAEEPLTRAELASTMTKVRTVADSIVLKTKGQTPKAPVQSGPASREEIVSALFQLYSRYKPNFRYTPNEGLLETKLLTIPEAHPSRQHIQTLIKWGFIGRFDPIATSKSPGLKPQEFGFVVAQFLARLSELTHTPSSKFSPVMMRDGG